MAAFVVVPLLFLPAPATPGEQPLSLHVLCLEELLVFVCLQRVGVRHFEAASHHLFRLFTDSHCDLSTTQKLYPATLALKLQPHLAK